MSMTIAQRILSVRRQIPDLPPSLPAPGVSFLAQGVGEHIPAGTYYCIMTQFNQYGESLGCAELGPFTLLANSYMTFQVNYVPTATVLRLYITLPNGGQNNEILYTDLPVPNTYALPFVFEIDALPLATGAPPSRGTAWMPNLDGQQFSVTALYQWLNNALNKLSHAVNGIQDYCGVPTLAGQPLYKLPGQWLNISDVWYGGYWIQGGQRQWFYRRNAVTTDVLAAATISIQSDQQVMEVSPQPDRNSGVTATAGLVLPTDTSMAVVDGSQFLLPFGFLMVSGSVVDVSDNTFEIMAYSNIAANGVISGLIRGIGGTVAQSWVPESTVTELSLFWCGKRIFSTDSYSPTPHYVADGGIVVPANPPETVIPAPFGWGPLLDKYMLAQVKYAEQDVETASRMEQQALKDAVAWVNANRGVNQFVQVGGANHTVAYDETIAGGLIVPALVPIVYLAMMSKSRYHVSGGFTWLLCISMLLPILVPERFDTWVKQLISKSVRTFITALQCIRKALVAELGSWNLGNWDYALSSSLLKSAARIHGRNENVIGSSAMEELENYSTSEREESLILLRRTSLSDLLETSYEEENAPRYPKSSRLLGRLYVKVISILQRWWSSFVGEIRNSFPIQLRESDIVSLLKIGTRTCRRNCVNVFGLLVRLNSLKSETPSAQESPQKHGGIRLRRSRERISPIDGQRGLGLW